jgi:hypothetical protein
MPFRSREKYAGAACVAAAKNPVQSSRPGSSRSFGEYALLEDSRYMSQERYFAAAITRKTLVISVAYRMLPMRHRLESVGTAKRDHLPDDFARSHKSRQSPAIFLS